MAYSYDRTASSSKVLAPLLKKISEGGFRAPPDEDGNLDPWDPPHDLNAKAWAELLREGLVTAGPKVGFRLTVELSAKGKATLAALIDKHRGKVLYEQGRDGYNHTVDVTVDDRRIGRWEREITDRATVDRGLVFKSDPNLDWRFEPANDPDLRGLSPPHVFEGARLPAAAKKWLEGELKRRGVIG